MTIPSSPFRSRGSVSLQVAVLLLIVAVAMAVLLDIKNMRRGHAALLEQKQSQETALEEAIKVKNQLEALAGQTALLAEQGNPNAQALVEQLREQGIEFHPPR